MRTFTKTEEYLSVIYEDKLIFFNNINTFTFKKKDIGIIDGNIFIFDDIIQYKNKSGVAQIRVLSKTLGITPNFISSGDITTNVQLVTEEQKEKLKIEEFKLVVPDNIKIYTSWSDHEGNNLYISFNKNKQLLGTDCGVFIVNVYNNEIFKKVQCILKPCKYEDLEVGDLIFAHNNDSKPNFEHLSQYHKVVANKKHATIVIDSVVVINIQKEIYNFYKIYKNS